MARLVIAAASLLPVLAFALGPKDPFTPPARASVASADARAASPRSELTGVRLGKTPAALIDGQWTALGDNVNGARLVAVRLREVVLQHADGRNERIALFPEPPPPAASSPSPASLIVKKELP